MAVELNKLYPPAESKNIVDWLLQSVTGLDKHELILGEERAIDPELENRLMAGLKELLANKPIQYVTGQAFFYGLELEVDESVLIPRPETEELVRWAIDDHKHSGRLRVLDAGTGSGCIIVSLGRHLAGAELTAVDISSGALRLARRNAAKYNIKVQFRETDILDRNQWASFDKFDLILSNPPYVRECEKKDMNDNVIAFEPHRALFVPDHDPLLFYRALAGFAMEKLSENGCLYVEINQEFGSETRDLMLEQGFREVILKKDFRGKHRMIRAGL
jgi:release factor glutamine methyltransferase